MALTEIAIVNMALARMGKEQVIAFKDMADVSLENIYDYTRDELLQYFPWKFAIARSQLTQVALTTSNLWSFKYAIPADSLRVLSLESDTAAETAEPRWDIEETDIVTNEESSADKVWIRYIKQITDPTLFTMDFLNVFVLLLAVRLSIPVASNQELKVELSSEFTHEVLNAFNVNRAMGFTLHKSRVEKIMEASFIELIQNRIKSQQGG